MKYTRNPCNDWSACAGGWWRAMPSQPGRSLKSASLERSRTWCRWACILSLADPSLTTLFFCYLSKPFTCITAALSLIPEHSSKPFTAWSNSQIHGHRPPAIFKICNLAYCYNITQQNPVCLERLLLCNGRTMMCWTPGFPRACSPSRCLAGRSRRLIWPSTTRQRCWRQGTTSSSSGSPAWS